MAADGDRFDDIFVDLDFSRVTEYGTGDLGYGDAAFADYEDSLGVIPEAEWQEHVEELERRNIGCAQSISSCTYLQPGPRRFVHVARYLSSDDDSRSGHAIRATANTDTITDLALQARSTRA
ncbi:MAG: hypothetical protein KatS3mg038_2891 [Candidatus Kapaibacterium sp.]|nr:MAG: hypothetical protein KatS3mg038_2891 [Candidatus Kapabacteria bacterium]